MYRLHNLLIRNVTTFFALAILVGLATAQGNEKTVQSPVGNYYLQGVREVGSQIILFDNGKFSYFLSYGAVDQSAAGTWRKDGQSIVLDAAALPEPSFLTAMRLPELNRNDGKDTPPLMAVVKVVSYQLGLTWSNMVVTAEFADGKVRSGKTGTGGTLLFIERTEPEWLDLPIVRVAVEYPPAKVGKRWFPFDSTKAKTLVVEFEPGNLARQNFESLRLVFNQTETEASLTTEGATDDKGWRYVRE